MRKKALGIIGGVVLVAALGTASFFLLRKILHAAVSQLTAVRYCFLSVPQFFGRPERCDFY